MQPKGIESAKQSGALSFHHRNYYVAMQFFYLLNIFYFFEVCKCFKIV